MTKTTRSKKSRQRRTRRGSVMLVTALTLPVLAGFAGLGVDVGIWESNKRSLQTAADAAAISGALEKIGGGNLAAIRAVALREAGRNGFGTVAGTTYVINNPPTGGTKAGDPNAVEVYLTRPEKPLLASLVFGGSVTLAVRSVATMQAAAGGGKACVLALHPSTPQAVQVTGSTTVDLSSCVIAANSVDASAIDITGSATLDAYSLWTQGGYALGGSADATFASPPHTHAAAIADPFAGLPIPIAGSCNHNNKKVNKGSTTLGPGTYCGGIDIGSHAVVTFNPGTYVINRGDFNVNAQATILCNCTGTNGVTFILTSTSGASQIGKVTINGGAGITLKAPSADGATYRGLLFFQDPAASTSGTNKFNGNSSMNLQGAIYFPSQEVQWSGNNETTNCIEVVARTVTFTGNSYLDVSGCPVAGVTPIQTLSAAKVKVVE